MRTLMALALLALAATTASFAGGSDRPDFSFLEGRWVGELDGATIEEVWLPDRNGAMTGCMRLFDETGAVTLYELFSIAPGDEGPLFRIRHFDADLQPWESEADGPKVFRVEPGEGSARIIPVAGDDSVEYGEFRADDGGLTFHLEFKGDRPPLEIRYERP